MARSMNLVRKACASLDNNIAFAITEVASADSSHLQSSSDIFGSELSLSPDRLDLCLVSDDLLDPSGSLKPLHAIRL